MWETTHKQSVFYALIAVIVTRLSWTRMTELPGTERIINDAFSHFDTKSKCDRQTDQQTEGHIDTQTPVSISLYAQLCKWTCTKIHTYNTE